MNSRLEICECTKIARDCVKESESNSIVYGFEILSVYLQLEEMEMRIITSLILSCENSESV